MVVHLLAVLLPRLVLVQAEEVRLRRGVEHRAADAQRARADVDAGRRGQRHLRVEDAVLRPVRPVEPPAPASPSALRGKVAMGGDGEGGGYDDYLSGLREERLAAEGEARVRDRLAALHTVPMDAPAAEGDEQMALADLLGRVRAVAERQVDRRPRTAGSARGSSLEGAGALTVVPLE